jgi:hypothetical protein
MPFTGFWERWRRRHLQQRAEAAKPPGLREAEKQREAVEREAAKRLAAVVTNARAQQRDDNS